MAETQHTFGHEDRCVWIAKAMLEKKATVRSIASQFGVSKSTVHKDLVERLPHVHFGIYCEVRELLMKNKAERHLRGGEATRRKYCQEKQDKPKEI